MEYHRGYLVSLNSLRMILASAIWLHPNECDNLYQKYFLLEEKLAEYEARFNSQQISFDDRESACLAREKLLEILLSRLSLDV